LSLAELKRTEEQYVARLVDWITRAQEAAGYPLQISVESLGAEGLGAKSALLGPSGMILIYMTGGRLRGISLSQLPTAQLLFVCEAVASRISGSQSQNTTLK